MKARDVSPVRDLSSSSGLPLDGPRLAWTSWLKTKEFPSDDAQVMLTPTYGNDVE